MKPLRLRMQDAAKRAGLSLHLAEVDYSLGHILSSIYQNPELCRQLLFKGGTALRKAYYPDYRFSLDLDFTALPGTPYGRELEGILGSVIVQTEARMMEYGPFSLVLRRYIEKQPHPTGQEAFDIHIKFPWHASFLCRAKLEIAYDESLLTPARLHPLIHQYEEKLEAALLCYSLEEILAEKLRALLQAGLKMEQRGWGVRPRDYYDIWQILLRSKQEMVLESLPELLQQKCQLREVDGEHMIDAFRPSLLKAVESAWSGELLPVLAHPPPFAQVVADLQTLLRDVVSLPEIREC